MKFLVTYNTEHTKFDEWMKMSEVERNAKDPDLQTAWNSWMEAHRTSLLETASVGRPKRITVTSMEDARNDIMLYSIVEAESLEDVGVMFKDHPHLGVLDGWIEIMKVSSIG